MRTIRRAIVALLLLASTGASAIDLFPGEIRAPRKDSFSMQLLWQRSHFGEYFAANQAQPGRPRLVGTLETFRLGYGFEIGGQPAYVFAQVPYGRLRTETANPAIPGTSGFGDSGIAIAYWPYANRATETYFGIAAYLLVPSGDYRNDRLLNVGENRYRQALQAGYHTSLTPRLAWMFAADAMRHEKNDDFTAAHATLERKTLYSLQTGFLHQTTSSLALGVTYFQSHGGETAVNGVWRDDAMRQERYMLTGITEFPFGRIALQYGADLKTRSGYFEDSRWTVRYLRRF